jgi:lysophospholipase L1-like esterase
VGGGPGTGGRPGGRRARHTRLLVGSGFKRFGPRRWALLAGALLIALGGVHLGTVTPAAAHGHRHRAPARMAAVASGHWVAAWGAAPQAPTAGNLSVAGFHDQTIRELVLASAGGSMVRVRLANTFGSRTLLVGRAAVAVAAGVGARLAPASSHALSFAGQASVSIPPGAEAISDPVRLTIAPLTELAISLFLPGPTGPATQHVLAQQVGYVAAGAHAGDSAASAFTVTTDSWYYLNGVDVLAPRSDLGAVVALGDSITDGVGSPVNANARWPNDLARRLAALRGSTLSVVDEGIGGNRVLNDSPCCGVNAVARFDRDVRDQAAARDVIVLEGINDIGFSASPSALTVPHTDVSAAQIIGGYEQLIALAHAAGLRIFGATLTPFAGARYWTPVGERKREAVNRWILTAHAFDGVVDFAAATADPRDPERLAPAYDSGDHLHPDAAGYRAMAAAIDLRALLSG